MIKQACFSTVCLICALVSPADAQKAAVSGVKPMPIEFNWTQDEPIVRERIVAGMSVLRTGETPDEDALSSIVTWIANAVGLPAIYDHPRIERVSTEELAGGPRNSLFVSPRGILSRYDSARMVIHLPNDWRSDTPGGISVVVHEMAHHLQAVAGLQYGCHEERERLAYIAQERWLAAFGQNLEKSFGIDPQMFMFLTECYIP
jgi:hypothetical protein